MTTSWSCPAPGSWILGGPDDCNKELQAVKVATVEGAGAFDEGAVVMSGGCLVLNKFTVRLLDVVKAFTVSTVSANGEAQVIDLQAIVVTATSRAGALRRVRRCGHLHPTFARLQTASTTMRA